MSLETPKTAFITGITGMDGSYLCEFLLEKNYIVHGLIRRSSSFNTKRIANIYQDPHTGLPRKLILHYGDMSDASCIERLIREIKPDEVYNLAAMSHVRVSFDTPEYTSDIDGIGTLRLLEACKHQKKKIKFYQAGTSEMFGGVYKEAQDENTPFYPRSPYAVAKVYAYWITKNYREAYDMFAVNGILFNHTSPRRGETFVEQKIVKAAIAILNNTQNCLYLGNIYSYRDIGHAKDYVKAMWMMLQHNKPDDYVVSTGKTYQIKYIVNLVFSKIGIQLVWHGKDIDEYATWKNRVVVKIDPKYYRPSEVDSLVGNHKKITNTLGWNPTYTLDKIIEEMINVELSKEN